MGKSVNRKTVVITGSTRGLGFEMAKQFHKSGWNVVINGLNSERLQNVVETIRQQEGDALVEGFIGNVAEEKDLQDLINFSVEQFGNIDIWINNAGVNQPMKPVWELTNDEIDSILNVDLKGTIKATRLATLQMEKQPEGGYIYNVEGLGSNNKIFFGFSLYGTSKCAITYFTQAFAKELEEKHSKVKIGRLSPGIMITDFLNKALDGKEEIHIPEKTKKVYNIFGDYPDIIAEYLVENMLNNTKNNVQIVWLTGRKATWRVLTSGYNKRNFFE